MLPKTSMTSKTKTRQTSKQPISTKQIVALFVHTKINTTIKYSGIEHTDKSSMNKNSKSNKKHTRIALVAIALLRFLCSSPPKNPPMRAAPKRISSFHPKKKPLSLSFSHLYISPLKTSISFRKGKFSYFLSSSLPFFLNLPIKSNLPNFKFPSKTF